MHVEDCLILNLESDVASTLVESENGGVEKMEWIRVYWSLIFWFIL